VQILGPVQIVGAQGPAPKTPATSKTNQSVVQRATELIAFLALNPRATAVQVHGALWPGKDPHGGAAQQTRNSHTSRARSWLESLPLVSSTCRAWGRRATGCARRSAPTGSCGSISSARTQRPPRPRTSPRHCVW
jgi:hypothetical protein